MIETKIIDNFLPMEVLDNFRSPFFRGEIPLYYTGPEMWMKPVEEEYADHFQFEHNFYVQEVLDVGSKKALNCCGSPSQSFGAVSAITSLIGHAIMDHMYPCVTALVRAQLNVVPETGTKMKEGFHTDYQYKDIRNADVERMSPHAVGLLYLNTTNGPTIFEDGEEIDCVENRLVIFDGLRPHTSSSCTDKRVRIALNTNYFVIEDRVTD